MNLKRRYLCVASVAGLFTVVCCILVVSLRRADDADHRRTTSVDMLNYAGEAPSRGRRHYVESRTQSADDSWSTVPRWNDRPRTGDARHCRMSTCFDVSRCRSGFTVHVHPGHGEQSAGGAPPTSFKYSEIVRALRASRYYTADPRRACVLVVALDTLDRDRLSAEYAAGIAARIQSLRWWRGGVNHVVFNLYSGTWPDYDEDGLGFDVGRAMLAKASTSRRHYRPGYDVSFPLFHKEHSFSGGEPGALTSNQAPPPPVRRYLLSFKGKRYLVGIGSETRNSLYHIHNGQDIVLLTTCRHGKGWKNVEDRRCETDNQEYERFVNALLCELGRIFLYDGALQVRH